MHELAIAQGLVDEAERVATENAASRIDHVVVRVGALSGVEPGLLARAFTVARSGSRAANATLEIETAPIEVRCRTCGCRSTVDQNRLLCTGCGDWHVDVVSGEDLLLVRLELSAAEPAGMRSDLTEARSA